MGFDDLLRNTLYEYGFIEFILPFLLLFAICFAILEKIKIFGKKSVNVVISLVIGITFVTVAQDLVRQVLTAIPQVGVVLIAILMALMIIGLLGGNFGLTTNGASGWFAIVAFGIVVWIFGASANPPWWNMPDWLYFLTRSDIGPLIITILVFAIVIYFITKEDTPKNSNKESFAEQFGKMLSGRGGNSE